MREVRAVLERDLALAGMADAQYGVVSAVQLVAAGFSTSAIGRAVEKGRLVRLHRGVYAAGHRCLTIEGLWMAAVLAAGPGAVLSHRDAAALWDLRRVGDRAYVEVSVPRAGGRRRRAGLRVHRSITLGEDAVTEHRGIPVTTPERTLRDLARVVSPAAVLRATEQARQQRLIAPDVSASEPTRSDYEAAFLLLCADHGIPAPAVNVAVGPYTVDFLWPGERLVVEVDAHHTHGSEVAFEADRERGVWLETHGHRLLRVSGRQVVGSPAVVARAVIAALAALTRP